jgi:carbohydrate-selective porin OprB
VNFDFQYVSDSLWNLKSVQKERFASWNRFRGTVDIDFGKLTGWHDLYFHATALWQGGGNLGAYLGLLTSPSGMSSMNTCRLDSWWIEKRWLNQRITARLGQFAGQDFYGAQHYAASFIFEPMGYALGNLFTDLESFDPPAGNGSARGADSQFVFEVDGGSHGPRAFCAKPNRPGSTVRRNSSEYFGDWIYSGQGRIVGARVRQC